MGRFMRSFSYICTDMKRLVLLAVAALMALVSCGPSYREVKVTSFAVESITPVGFNSFKLQLGIGVDNPSKGFSLQDVDVTMNMAGRPTLYLSADEVVVEGATARKYKVPVSGRFAGQFNIFRLLSLGESLYGDDVTMDVKCRLVTSSGFGKKVDMKGLEVKNLLKR